jgi:hypothetical protein
MRRALAAISLLFCGVARAECVSTTLACNAPLQLHLAPGCHDQLRFGSVGQYLRASLYPLSPSLTNTSLAVDMPTAPFTSGGQGASIAFVPSPGSRTFTVSSQDGGAQGDYVVALACADTPYSANAKDSTDQFISCGQTVEWSLTPDSGTFTNRPDLAFASVVFYGVAGDTVSLEVESSDFEPRFGVYDRVRLGKPFVLSEPVSRSKDALELKLPYTGIYDLLVRARDLPGYGRFRVTMHGCQSPPCLPPTLLRVPSDVLVPPGRRATLSAEAIGFGALRYVWHDRSTVLAPQVGEGVQFTTPPVTGTQWYAVTATTPCGSAESSVVAVGPMRARATRH